MSRDAQQVSDHVLTPEERNAIRALKRLAKKWPPSLWLYSASGTLCVMRAAPGNERADRHGGVDQRFVIASVDIPNDGGGW